MGLFLCQGQQCLMIAIRSVDFDFSNAEELRGRSKKAIHDGDVTWGVSLHVCNVQIRTVIREKCNQMAVTIVGSADKRTLAVLATEIHIQSRNL